MLVRPVSGPGCGVAGRVGPSLGCAGPGGAERGYAEVLAAGGRGLKLSEKLSSLVGQAARGGSIALWGLSSTGTAS